MRAGGVAPHPSVPALTSTLFTPALRCVNPEHGEGIDMGTSKPSQRVWQPFDLSEIREDVADMLAEIRVRERTATRLREMADAEQDERDRLHDQLRQFAEIMVENATAHQRTDVIELFTELGFAPDLIVERNHPHRPI